MRYHALNNFAYTKLSVYCTENYGYFNHTELGSASPVLI